MLPNEIGPVAPVEIFVTIFTHSEPVVGCQSLARVAVDDDAHATRVRETRHGHYLGIFFNKFSFLCGSSSKPAVGRTLRGNGAKLEASQENRDCLLEDNEEE